MHKISSVIFDLGGVLLDLDQDKTLRAFNRLGLDLDELNEQSTLFKDFETGKINAADFRQAIQTASRGQLTVGQIDDAWNKMLLFVANQRFDILAKLRKDVKIFLLSNTNSIHIDWFKTYIEEIYGWVNWCALFEHQFLSYETGLRKPNPAIYEHVISTIGIDAKACLFVDDNKANINGAKSVGLQTIWAKNPLNLHLYEQIKQHLA